MMRTTRLPLILFATLLMVLTISPWIGCGEPDNRKAASETASQSVIPATNGSNPRPFVPNTIPSDVAATFPSSSPATMPFGIQGEIWKLAGQLDDDDIEVRFKAVSRLMELGKPALPVFEEFVKTRKPASQPANEDEDEAFFSSATLATARQRQEQEEIKKLVDKLRDNNVKVRDEAAEKLKTFGRTAWPILAALAADKDADPELTVRVALILDYIASLDVGRPYSVVYVIDRSGSMIYMFNQIRWEVMTSIGQLKDSQDFHLIYFAKAAPAENPLKVLVPANRQNKIFAAEFLKGIFPEGQTDPVPAMERALDVLKDAKNGRKLVYFITDGQFPESKAALAKLLAERNPPGPNQAIICTFQYGDGTQDQSVFLKKIAQKNGGRYKYINVDDE